jgi:hypothetical protein
VRNDTEILFLLIDSISQKANLKRYAVFCVEKCKILIMSIYTLEEVKCACGEVFETEIVSAISVIDDPHLKDYLLDGSINLVRCPKCSDIFYVERFILYSDHSQELIAFVYPLDCQNEAALYRKKMIDEMEAAKNGFGDGHVVDYEPILLFGIEDLIQMLKSEQDVQDEEMILEYICSSLDIDIFKIRQSLARKLNVPKVIPIMKGVKKKDLSSINCALHALIKYNPNLISYVHLSEKLSSSPALANLLLTNEKG